MYWGRLSPDFVSGSISMESSTRVDGVRGEKDAAVEVGLDE